MYNINQGLGYGHNVSPMIKENAQKAILLLVDDDSLITSHLKSVLENKYQLVIASSRNEALDLLTKSEQAPEIALVDLSLPPAPHSSTEGFGLIKDLLTLVPDLKILVLSEQGDEADIQHALTLGAVDVVPKSSEASVFEARLEHQLMLKQVETGLDDLNIETAIIGESPVMKALRDKIDQLSEPSYPVLIEGEPGTGKELIARVLHEQSSRNEKPYIDFNCAAVSSELIGPYLFGCSSEIAREKSIGKEGLLHSAKEGTLFINEIDGLPLELQSKLLNIIETGEYTRTGEAISRKVQARIITATCKKLSDTVKAGKFRDDLYHRINTLKIKVPPLNERGNDSLLLMRHFRRLYKDSIKPFTLNAAATSLWMKYSFPGNIRELRNVVVRLGTKYTGINITAEQLKEELEIEVDSTRPEKLKQGFSAGKFNDAWLIKQISSGHFNFEEAVSELESYCIQLAMDVFDNNLDKASKALNMNRTELFNRINRKGNKNVS